ncbi:PAS domain-containing protein [Aquimarina sp. MMG016]|uniref:PAS domain-containing protein n=1 Tax=Aquimarina sp. MMG016 TaxID=2822690 RepID=UPI001B3A5E4F|nr:PAS domain-containing protein [Aquimarina sp. MMG016]MBQ4822783.1 PAS domain-containing protein [Aquimarina sp. MMG016]
MKELRGYDQMLSEKNKQLVNHSLPLLSWEFYGEHYSTFTSFKEDIENLKKISKKWDFNHNFYTEFVEKKSVVIVTSPKLEIVYASHNIEKMNGYMPEEVIGKSPKMFQGKDTCVVTSLKIREAVKAQEPFEVSILNYRKNKETYICMIKGFPIHDKKGKLINYIAFEKAA